MEAIRNLDELISIDGVSGVFLGPHDISCSMEIPEEYDNPLFVDTIIDVIKKCRKTGVGVGIHYDIASEGFKHYIDAGVNFLLDSADVIKMKQRIHSDIRLIKTMSM
jgi:2-keto-3-deoxy-L-rhamnonate aldolase RhmA